MEVGIRDKTVVNTMLIEYLGNVFPGATLPYGIFSCHAGEMILNFAKGWPKQLQTPIRAAIKVDLPLMDRISPDFRRCMIRGREVLHPSEIFLCFRTRVVMGMMSMDVYDDIIAIYFY
jgi:hypothetical protein